MLDCLPTDVLQSVFQRLGSPHDCLNLYKTCKTVRDSIRDDFVEATATFDDPCRKDASLLFFPQMKALKSLFIFRTYDVCLDLAPLRHLPLDKLYLNSGRHVINIPEHVALTVGRDRLRVREKTRDRRERVQGKPPVECLIDPKEYSTSKYARRQHH